ncbi:MAG: hypothetical protein ACLFQS_11610, partial [Bacteroidales bacterium]
NYIQMKKKQISVLILMLVCTQLLAQFKVTDASQHREPSWINALERNYIIVSAEGESIQEAQQNALLFIKERIVTSVADNVQATSEIVTEESNINNNVSTFLETYNATITTQSGDVSYLQGISLSKAEDYYWEQLLDKKAGIMKYRYHVKYPFPDFELQKLVMDYQIQQRKLSEQLQKLLEAISKVNTIEQINGNIAELQTLTDAFSDTRKDRAKAGITRYKELLNGMSLVETQSQPGEIRFIIQGGGRTFTTSKRPNVQSECARITGVKPQGNEWVIHYNSEYCYDDPENHIEVNYRLGTSPVRNKFYFNINEDAVDVSIREPIAFESIEMQEGKITKTKVNITLWAEHEAPFLIENISIQFNQSPPLTVKDINQRFEGKGNHYLTLMIDQELDQENTTSTKNVVSRLSCTLNLKEIKSNESRSLKILNHAYTTSW